MTIEVKATSPKARSLLCAALKWIRRIEERKDDLPASFLDNCDPMPLRKEIERHLASYNLAPVTEEEVREFMETNPDVPLSQEDEVALRKAEVRLFKRLGLPINPRRTR